MIIRIITATVRENDHSNEPVLPVKSPRMLIVYSVYFAGEVYSFLKVLDSSRPYVSSVVSDTIVVVAVKV